jgi:1-acyl-sn-glycerol-3-phosphate acyltransferase
MRDGNDNENDNGNDRGNDRGNDNDIGRFKPPSAELLWRLTAPLRAYHRPRFFGLEHLRAERPSLLVGNHTLYGVLDLPHLVATIYRERGFLVRGLGDRIHFQIPGWGELLRTFGAVVGTRENCARLMQAGQHILVFPGGGREVAKRKGEAYKLIWKERTGFARMAIQYGYTIVPVASVGPEECFDILVDANDVMSSPVGKFLNATGIARRFLRGGDLIFPLARGLGFTMLPRPERFYFSIGQPIETGRFAGHHEDPAALLALREEVRAAVEGGIAKLLEIRAQDPERTLLGSLFGRGRRKRSGGGDGGEEAEAETER